MPPSVSRRSVLQTGGVALVGAIAGCSELSTEKEPPPVPIFLENRDTAQHSVLIEVHSTPTDEAFAREVSSAPDEIAKVGEVTAEEFCIRGRLRTGGLDETCPTRGEEDRSQHGFMVVVLRSPPPTERERRLEIVNIEDAAVQEQ